MNQETEVTALADGAKKLLVVIYLLCNPTAKVGVHFWTGFIGKKFQNVKKC